MSGNFANQIECTVVSNIIIIIIDEMNKDFRIFNT